MKRLLNTDEAAEYCGIGAESFRTNCPVQPRRVRPGQKGLRYDVKDLDEWIDNLPYGGGETTPKTPDQWLDGLDKDQGRKELRQ